MDDTFRKSRPDLAANVVAALEERAPAVRG